MNECQNVGEKTMHFPNAYLAEDIPTNGYPKTSEAAASTFSTKQLLLNISQKSQENTSTGISFQATLLKRRHRHRHFSVNFAIFYRNTFIMEHQLCTGFGRRILRKIRNRHSYCSKRISRSQQLSQRADITEGGEYLRNIYRKLTFT